MTEPWWAIFRRHPVITGVMVGCTVLGAIFGPAWMDADWSLLKRVLAGALCGAGIGILITAPRMVG